jgi:hypothetical protein
MTSPDNSKKKDYLSGKIKLPSTHIKEPNQSPESI